MGGRVGVSDGSEGGDGVAAYETGGRGLGAVLEVGGGAARAGGAGVGRAATFGRLPAETAVAGPGAGGGW